MSDADLRVLIVDQNLMLVRGAVSPHRIQQVGATPDTRTPSGLWPSDHAGLVARFKITKAD